MQFATPNFSNKIQFLNTNLNNLFILSFSKKEKKIVTHWKSFFYTWRLRIMLLKKSLPKRRENRFRCYSLKQGKDNRNVRRAQRKLTGAITKKKISFCNCFSLWFQKKINIRSTLGFKYLNEIDKDWIRLNPHLYTVCRIRVFYSDF